MNMFSDSEDIMELYNYSYDYFVNLAQELFVLFQINYENIPQILFAIGILSAVLLLNRKLKKLARVQINDIDDVTSFNRLIDDEIGMLKNEYEKQNRIKQNNDEKTEVNNERIINNAPYSQAVNLAKRGYARDEIISLCSLTESEAELILTLHTNAKAA